MATKTLMTLEQFERLPDDGKLHELNEGELVKVTHPKYRHDQIAWNIQQKLGEHIHPKGLGRVYGEVMFLLSREPPTLRIPDVSFVAITRLRLQPPDEYIEGSPELAIEVVSPSDPAEELEEKIRQYFDAGAKLVWIVYPKTRSVHVYTAPRTPAILEENDMLEAPELFPGWSVPVKDLFQL